MADTYEFNPYEHGNHTKMKYLGTPGSCNVLMGTEKEDPKYKGVCGPEYEHYRMCLKTREFNREECRGNENELIHCEKTKINQN